MKHTIYRGFQITPVFNYTNGKSDVEYYRLSDPEDNGMIARGTLEKVKEAINERLSERPEIYEVQPGTGKFGQRTPIAGLIEALDYCHYWDGLLLADFRTM